MEEQAQAMFGEDLARLQLSLGLTRGRRSDRALAMGLGIAIGYS